MLMTDVLQLCDVSRTFTSGWGPGRRVLTAMNHVDLTIPAGRTLGLVGESGSGKSTTGRVALGLLRPTSGAVRFAGEPMRTPGGRRRSSRAGDLQAVLQHPQWSLNPRLRIVDSVAEPLAARHGGRLARHVDEAQAMLGQVGLEPVLATRLPHELSGGQRQRVAIARALVTRPRFIVFDEAVSALDVSVQAQILNLLRDLQAERGFAALFISHDLAAVRYVADEIAVMRNGVVVEHADTDVFYREPRHEYSRQLMEAL